MDNELVIIWRFTMRKVLMIMTMMAFLAMGAFAGCDNSSKETPAPTQSEAPAATNSTQAN